MYEDMFIKVGDFIILDIGENQDMTVILGRPFLVAKRQPMDFEKCKIILRVENKQQSLTKNSPVK